MRIQALAEDNLMLEVAALDEKFAIFSNKSSVNRPRKNLGHFVEDKIVLDMPGTSLVDVLKKNTPLHLQRFWSELDVRIDSHFVAPHKDISVR